MFTLVTHRLHSRPLYLLNLPANLLGSSILPTPRLILRIWKYDSLSEIGGHSFESQLAVLSAPTAEAQASAS